MLQVFRSSVELRHPETVAVLPSVRPGTPSCETPAECDTTRTRQRPQRAGGVCDRDGTDYRGPIAVTTEQQFELLASWIKFSTSFVQQRRQQVRSVNIYLENCYGIKKLETELDFSSTRVYALYAPNGAMKSSLAKTFQDVAEKTESQDRIFPNRQTVRQITDDEGRDLSPEEVLVVTPYDEALDVNEQTSTLLLDTKLKQEYEDLLRTVARARDELLQALRQQSHSRKNLALEISEAIMQSSSQLDTALQRIESEILEETDTPFADIEYDTIFNEKVLSALDDKDLRSAIEGYAHRYDELLENSTYFKKGTFDYYNATQIAGNLSRNGFFKAKHAISLKATSGDREISNQAELEELISEEKDAILTDTALRKMFDDIARKLDRNADLRKFYQYVRTNEAVLARLSNPAKLRQDVIISYVKTHEDLYADWLSKFRAAGERRKQLEIEAQAQRTRWEDVIEIFNDRFFVPFTVEAKNKAEVSLGQTSIIEVGFTYTDGSERASLRRNELLRSLSTGERKALYILNVIFEIETRIANDQTALVIVDDLADSFDYRNKYAIIQYLKDISEDRLFKLLIMTHNFDFLRTIESRFVGYSNCLMASRSTDGVTLQKASGVRNVFISDWKRHFFDDTKKKIACVPFLRNLIEMTTGSSDPQYMQLTSILHLKPNDVPITVGQLEAIFCNVCDSEVVPSTDTELVHDLIMREANDCLAAPSAIGLEGKVVLAIAIRLLAEQFIVDRIQASDDIISTRANQTQRLIQGFKEQYPSDDYNTGILDRVSLMTPESIHLNSFMYEPLVDMSDDHLRKLYSDTRRIAGAGSA